MDPDRWALVQALFEEASALSARDRERFIDERCGDDEELRELLRRMVSEIDSSTDFLDAPTPSEGSARPLEGNIGPFELREELGRGGMGVVYRAHDAELARDIALKLLSSAPPTTERMLDRFTREARAVARLEHPGIVSIHQVGEDRGYRWFSMDYLSGGDLNTELIAQRGRNGLVAGGPRKGSAAKRARKNVPARVPVLPRPGEAEHVKQTLRRVADIADALDYAHSRGVVHRDIKPHNLLIDDELRLRLVDFGLAKDESQGTVTGTEHVGGTPHYMSPEQAASDRVHIDHRTDIYSLGVVLFEMLTLKRPYRGDTAQEVITAIMHRDPPPLRRVDRMLPRELELVCSKALARNVDDRYATAGAFAEDLRRILAFQPVRAKKPTLWRRTERFARRHRGALVGVALAAVAVVIALGMGTSFARGERLQREFDDAAAWLDVANWRERPLEELVQIRARIEALEARAGALSTSERSRLGELRQRFDALEAVLLEEARTRFSRALTTDRGLEGFDPRGLFAGTRILLEAATLFGNETLEESPEEFWLPPISVRARDATGSALAGSAFARTLDPTTGLPGISIQLGTLPVVDGKLPSGYYRIVVEPEGHAAREYTRLVALGGSDVDIECVVTATDPRDGMVLVEGDTMLLDAGSGRSFTLYAGTPVEIGSFLVDEALVSIGDYRRYLESAPASAYPAGWAFAREQGDDVWAEVASGAYDDLPMVGLSAEQAHAYAESQGKRLLTLPEWEFLANGTTSRTRPYSDPERYRGAGEGATDPPIGAAASARHFLAQAAPVRSFEDARSEPHGLYHLLGNVREYTDTLGFEFLDDGSVEPRLRDVRVCGAPWYYEPERKTNLARSNVGRGSTFASFAIGFRCARSIEP